MLVDGKPVGKTVIRPFQFFTIGTTHLAIGPADKPWPQFDLSDFQLRPPEEQPADEAAADESPEEEAEPPEGETQQDSQPDDAAVTQRHGFRWGTKAIATALLIIINTILLMLFLSDSGEGEQVAAAEEEQSQAKLSKMTREFAPGVEINGENGRLRITGYVDSDEDRDTLIREAHGIDPDAVIKVRSTQSLLVSVREQLQSDGWAKQLHAAAGDPGVVRIAGQVRIGTPQVRERWKQTEGRIRRNIPLKQLLIEFDEPAENKLGQSKSDGDALRTPIPQPKTKSMVRGNSLPILDVRVSRDKVFTLPNGRQVSIGGRLPDGSRVQEIDLSHAVVRTSGGELLIIPFGIGG